MANKKRKALQNVQERFPKLPLLNLCTRQLQRGQCIVERELCCESKDHKGQRCGWTECPSYESEIRK